MSVVIGLICGGRKEMDILRLVMSDESSNSISIFECAKVLSDTFWGYGARHVGPTLPKHRATSNRSWQPCLLETRSTGSARPQTKTPIRL